MAKITNAQLGWGSFWLFTIGMCKLSAAAVLPRSGAGPMSDYSTIDRIDEHDVAVKVYIEIPMVLDDAVCLQVGLGVAFLDPDEATRLATSLLVAAQRARQAATVDRVVATGAAHESSAR